MRINHPLNDTAQVYGRTYHSVRLNTPKICIHEALSNHISDRLRRTSFAEYIFTKAGQNIRRYLHTHALSPFSVNVASTQDRKSTRLNPVTNAHIVCRLLLAQ